MRCRSMLEMQTTDIRTWVVTKIGEAGSRRIAALGMLESCEPMGHGRQVME